MKTISLMVLAASVATLAACERVTEESIEQNAEVYSLNLSLDEMNIWEDMTQAQRDRAVLFIENGGTLIASLGDE